MTANYKKPQKGKLKAAFLDAAQIARNILVAEPWNKHRIKQRIFLDKQAGKEIEYLWYEGKLVDGHLLTVITGTCASLAGLLALMATGITGGLPVAVMFWGLSGALTNTLIRPVFLIATHGNGRMVRRFERQVDRKLLKLANKQRKKNRQLLLNTDI